MRNCKLSGRPTWPRSGNVDEAVKYAKQLIGYDPKTDKFDVKKASAPHEPQVYATLAAIVHSKENKPELAERIMDQAVEVNPKSAEASSSAASCGSSLGQQRRRQRRRRSGLQVKARRHGRALVHVRPGCRGQRVRQVPRVPRQGEEAASQTTFSSIKQRLCWRSGSRSPRKARHKQHYDKAMAEIEEGIKKVSGIQSDADVVLQGEAANPGERRRRVRGKRSTRSRNCATCARKSSTTSRLAFCLPKGSGMRRVWPSTNPSENGAILAAKW